jgi:hypothetical protein
MRRLVRASLLVLVAFAGPVPASEVELSGVEGHPRARFPLAVHLGASGDPATDAAARQTLVDWNAVAEATLGTAVFREVTAEPGAAVLVRFPREPAPMMGVARVVADAAGVIELPVRVTVFPVEARGQTPREVIAYQIIAHELGHALGLAHTRDPRSLMCCVRGSLDFDDPQVRHAYISSRRAPDVRSAAAQLGEHYRRFWSHTP